MSELVELEMQDLDLVEGVLRVRGKGRKDRLTPIGSQAIKALQRYFEMRSMEPRCNGSFAARVFLWPRQSGPKGDLVDDRGQEPGARRRRIGVAVRAACELHRRRPSAAPCLRVLGLHADEPSECSGAAGRLEVVGPRRPPTPGGSLS